MDYRESHLSPDHASRYNSAFEVRPYRKMIWQFEKNILNTILDLYLKDTDIYHLDFACGTGRILSHLENIVKESTGVDVSPSMLLLARSNCKNANLIKADITQEDVLGQNKYNLITAFRFFPNAQEDLRKQAMQVIINHLRDDGYIVFNNHKNMSGTRYRIARLVRHPSGYKGMSEHEVKELLSMFGLHIVRSFSLSIFPSSEKHHLLPIYLLSLLEKTLSNIPVFHKYAENKIYVCQLIPSKKM